MKLLKYSFLMAAFICIDKGYANDVNQNRIQELGLKYNTQYERPKSCPLESKRFSDLVAKIQTVQAALQKSNCKNKKDDKLDEILASLKEIKEDDLLKNKANGKLEDVISGLDESSSLSVLGGVKLSSMFSGLSSFLDTNKCKLDDKRVLESIADVVYDATQIGLLSGSKTGVTVAAGGFLISSGLKIIDQLLKQKYDFSQSSDRLSFIKVNCSFYDIRREMELIGVFDLENSSAKKDLEDAKDLSKKVADKILSLDQQKKDITTRNSDFDKKILNLKLADVKPMKVSLEKIQNTLKTGIVQGGQRPTETQKLMMITEVAKEYESFSLAMRLYSAANVSLMPMLDDLFIQQMKAFDYNDFINFQTTLALSVDGFDQKVRANILFHVERINADIAKKESELIATFAKEKEQIAETVSKEMTELLKSLDTLKKIELRIGALIQPQDYSAADDGSENLVSLIEIHDQIASNLYGEWGQKFLKFSTEQSVEEIKTFKARYNLFDDKYITPISQGHKIDIATSYACQDAQKLRLLQKRARALIEQGYDFLATNKDLFYSDLKNKFFLRMNEAGKANFLLGNEEKIQRHYMSATYANKILRNENVSEDLKERYLTKRFYNTYYIGYPMLEMSGLTEKIHYVQDTYDRLECSKFLNKQLNF